MLGPAHALQDVPPRRIGERVEDQIERYVTFNRRLDRVVNHVEQSLRNVLVFGARRRRSTTRADVDAAALMLETAPALPVR
jgi:hypothetical protein